MSKKPTKKQSDKGLEQDRTDWNRLDAIKDADIDVSDIAALDADIFSNAQVVMPPAKNT